MRAAAYAGPDLTVTFEDRGQDFLEWDIKAGKVVDSRPFQNRLWVGVEILGTPKKGQLLTFKRAKDAKGTVSFIRYPLVGVKAHQPPAGPVARAPTIMRRPRQVRCAGCNSTAAESDILLHHCQSCADALAASSAVCDEGTA